GLLEVARTKDNRWDAAPKHDPRRAAAGKSRETGTSARRGLRRVEHLADQRIVGRNVCRVLAWPRFPVDDPHPRDLELELGVLALGLFERGTDRVVAGFEGEVWI